MKLLLFTFSIILSATVGLIAQNNWQPGSLFLNGEKIDGEIDDRQWPFHVNEVRFRKNQKAPILVYTPQDNVDFAVGSRRYLGMVVPIITNSRDLDQLNVDTTLIRKRVAGFVRQYYAGELELYQYIDESKKRHFYLKKADQSLVYLEYEKSLRADNPKKILKTSNTYKFQLNQILAECRELSGKILETDYALNDLRRLVQQWYDCQAKTPDFISSVGKGRFVFAPSAQMISTNLVAAFNNDRGTKSSKGHLGPAYGATVKYVFPGMRGKLALKLQGIYHQFKEASQTVSRQEGPINISIIQSLDQTSIQFFTLAEFQFNAAGIPLYTELGMTSGFITNFELLFSEVRVFEDGTQVVLDSTASSDMADGNDVGYTAGIGTYIGKLQLGLNASRSTRDRAADNRVLYRFTLNISYWLQ